MDSTTFNILSIILAFGIASIIEMIILPRIIYIAKKKKLFDLPDIRKKHRSPVPRLGGISFSPIIILVTLFLVFIKAKMGLLGDLFLDNRFPELILFICGLLVIYLLGIKDDLVGVRFQKKFIMQFIASLMIVGSGIYINNLHGLFGIYEIPAPIGIALSIFAIIYITNAINLIDGADGLASGVSAIALTTYGVIFAIYQMWTYASIAFITLGMLIPFFYYNFFHPTRKVFMGDTGSLTLGYILAFMMLSLVKIPDSTEIVPSGLLLLVLAALFIPLFDGLRVMIERIATKRGPFEPDRNHIHHKIIDLGFSKRNTVFIILFAGIALLILNWILLFFINSTIVCIIDLVLGTLTSALLFYLVKKKVTQNTTANLQIRQQTH